MSILFELAKFLEKVMLILSQKIYLFDSKGKALYCGSEEQLNILSADPSSISVLANFRDI